MALVGICLLEDLRSFLNSVLASHFVLCNIVLEKCHSKGFRHSEICHCIWDRILIYMGCFHKRPNYQENIKSFYTCSKVIWVCECLKAVLGEHQWGSRCWRTWERGWVENRGLLQTCVATIPICDGTEEPSLWATLLGNVGEAYSWRHCGEWSVVGLMDWAEGETIPG